MLLAAMNDVEIEAAVRLMDPDLRLALARNDVSSHVMAVLAKARISLYPHRWGM